MIVLDTNTVITSFENGQRFTVGELIVSDDLYEEYLVAETRHKEQVGKIKHASLLKGYDEAYYLSQYARVLNQYAQVSFAKMRGLGDVSIIALVACLVTDFGRKLPQIILDLDINKPTKAVVVTNDAHLNKKLKEEFDGLIDIINYDSFAQL